MNSVLVTIAPAIEALTRRYWPCAQRRDRDHELGEIAERRVQQSADGVAGSRGDRFGGMAQERGQRHRREHRQHE
jgi:hypothetical protein